ncbi:MAG: hypothetical protein JSS81_28625 [Acidobacteria bacterium]|nr:hypothetical protein [Acidobacteriota bacterium]
MRFAKLGEEVFIRQSEISCEEFRLYAIIVFHTFVDTGVCRMPLREISKIYNLDYDNLTRRYKILRKDFTPEEIKKLPEKIQAQLEKMKSPWLEKTKKGIRPLVGVKTVNSTVSEEEKTVNITAPDCKNYSRKRAKTVKTTVSLNSFKEPLNQEPLKSPTAPEAVAAAETNGHLSKFSLEECILYAEISKSRGELIKSVHALANSAYKTGEMDVFIEATLYPAAELTYEPDETEKLTGGLRILIEMRAEGEDWRDQQKWYTPEEWLWLTTQMEKAS